MITDNIDETIGHLREENSNLRSEITKLRAQIQSLEKEHARERRAIEGSNDGLFDRPLDNGNTWVSKQWRNTFKFDLKRLSKVFRIRKKGASTRPKQIQSRIEKS